MEEVKNYSKKVWQYIKENKFYLLVMLIGSVAFIMQMKEVILYADDFALGIISKGGLKEIWNYFRSNYMNWGGGLTCLWATTFLLFRIGVWKIFQCILIIVTVILATKMITYEGKRNKALVATFIWLCLYVLTIFISREVLYWLDGGLAYELTAFQIFLYFYYLYTRIHLKINKKYDKILLPIVAFFAGWSSAQTGPLVAVIPPLLILWKKVIQKEKVSKFYYITTIIGLIGFAIFYFAPGNNARMNLGFKDYANYNLIQKILYRTEEVYGLIFNFKQNQFMGIPFYMILLIGLNSVVGLYLFNEEENKKVKLLVKITSGIQIVFTILCLGIALNIPYAEEIGKIMIGFENLLYARWNGTLTLKVIVPYVITTLVMVSAIVEAYLIGIKKKDPMLVITIIAALIMQGIMVMAPYSPLRTTYYTIMFLWFAIAYLIKLAYEEKMKIGMPVIIVFTMYNLQLGIVAIVSYLIINSIVENNNKEHYKGEFIVATGIMLIIACGNYGKTINNYAINQEIYNQNITRVKEFKERQDNGGEEKVLYLLAPKDETYGFTPMAGTDWVEKAVKQYFELDEDVVLKTEKIE